MATTNVETRTRQGTCPNHGPVAAEKQVPRLRFPFVIWFVARRLSAFRPYRCPDCGAKAI
jgi:hypothetical protein